MCDLQASLFFFFFTDSIKEKGGRVFVHCHAGISRSATVCIAYMMRTRKMTVVDAYKFVKSKRPIISPNLHFMGQLLEYQEQLFSLTLESLPEREVPATSATQTTPKITTPVQSLAKTFPAHFTTTSENSCSAGQLAAEASIISMLTSRLQHETAVRGHETPKLSTCGRSSTADSISTRRPSRESLKLCLSASKSVTRRSLSSPQLSPCRVEASLTSSPITQPLNISSTCT